MIVCQNSQSAGKSAAWEERKLFVGKELIAGSVIKKIKYPTLEELKEYPRRLPDVVMQTPDGQCRHFFANWGAIKLPDTPEINEIVNFLKEKELLI